ncbi:antigen 5 like allergen Cul n 1-like [Anastrepha ludens]|uniref:antigen 5 like allergen Cul n 1-like n=1 Tax=Anastrepha ludens TaxID=28586 RepID=UPI0023AF1A69|nr:antigen 5 like allergen Cul n 1-like [Anastrepha ludens]
MQLKFTLLAFLLATFEIVSATNYCNSSLCPSGTHIACGNNGEFASSCQDPALITLTQANRNAIVNAHNVKRNLVAGGETKLEPACRMATMQWDDELAALAELNVKQCQLQIDDCHNTDTFLFSGQNLALLFPPVSATIEQIIQSFVDLWYAEIKDTTMADINEYPNDNQGRAIGTFTVMVADRNIRVGCAAATYTVADQPNPAVLVACNYATTNVIGFPIYKACPTPGSDCKTGKSTIFENLCSRSEVYDVNTWW